MDEQMMKSLVELIDESLAEIEELKKSNRFGAQEIKLDGPGDSLAGEQTNGSLDKADCDKDDEDDKKDKKAIEEKMDDHNEKKHDEPKDEDSAMKKADDDKDDKKDDKKDDDKDDKKKKMEDDDDYKFAMKKAESDYMAKMESPDLEKSEKSEDVEKLAKSYVDEKIAPIESQLSTITDMLKQIGDAPVAAKSTSYKDISPLRKSEKEVEPLNKSVVANKLFELKKSGTDVDSSDICAVELSNPTELSAIAAKYNLGE